MTIETLLKSSASELEAMSDKQLLEYFEPMLKFTRPDLAVKEREINPEAFGLDKNGKSKVKSVKVGSGISEEQRNKMKHLADQMGLDLGGLI